MNKARKNQKTVKPKNAKEIIVTLSGEVGDWLTKQAEERSLLNRRGGLQFLIHEKLCAQMRQETPA